MPRALALAWWLVLPAGLLELARFQDPVFREPKTAQLARTAASLSQRAAWFGSGRSIPFGPRSICSTKLTIISLSFHLWRNGVAFHLKHEVPVIAFPEAEEIAGERLPKGLGRYLDTGDAILWNREPRSYATRDLPATLSPIVIARVQLHDRSERLPGAGPFEEYAMTPEGLRPLGWRQETDLPGTGWWLQLQGVSEQPLNKSEYTPYTL